MGKPKSILVGDKEDGGILIEHIKSRNQVCIHAWYDSGYAGISKECFSLEEFCERLGIKKEEPIAKEVNKLDEKEELLEKFAVLEHKRWVISIKDIAATATIPKERLECWRKMWVPYNQLTEEQKEYSRSWAREIIRAMGKHGTALTDPTII